MVQELNRRTFVKKSAVAGAFVLTPLAQLLQPRAALAATRPSGFRFIHDDSVTILLGFAKKADRYDLSVQQGGRVVEFFPNAQPMRFHRLRTSYFDVEYFDPLAA